MKYILIDDCDSDIFTKEFENVQDAIEEGNRDFDYLTEYDKKRRNAFYLLESVNEDTEADDHFDGDVLKSWK